MKLLSIIVPCYNSQDYMERCITSLLVGGEAVEIIIVNDGSKDETAAIADRFASHFPSIVKAVHQENGGHGQAINTGLAHASGKYIKVVDSDDWVDANAYQEILAFLASQTNLAEPVDMLISNYVYEKQGAKRKKVIEYTSFLPTNQLFSWDATKRFPVGKYLLMHSVIYRRQLLIEHTLQLPKHTFYVDNLYVFEPLPMVKNMYYLNVDFYRYYIGREDQSVNEKVMIGRIDQQLAVNRRMVHYYSDAELMDDSLQAYMLKYLEIITTISSILLIREGSKESLQKKEALWQYIRQQDEQLYRKLRRGLFGVGVHLPGRLGRKTMVGCYKLAQKMYGFN